MEDEENITQRVLEIFSSPIMAEKANSVDCRSCFQVSADPEASGLKFLWQETKAMYAWEFNLVLTAIDHNFSPTRNWVGKDESFASYFERTTGVTMSQGVETDECPGNTMNAQPAVNVNKCVMK